MWSLSDERWEIQDENQLWYCITDRHVMIRPGWCRQSADSGQRIEWVSRITYHDGRRLLSWRTWTSSVQLTWLLRCVCWLIHWSIDSLSDINMISRSEPGRNGRCWCCLITDTTMSEDGKNYHHQIPYVCISYLIGLCCWTSGRLSEKVWGS